MIEEALSHAGSHLRESHVHAKPLPSDSDDPGVLVQPSSLVDLLVHWSAAVEESEDHTAALGFLEPYYRLERHPFTAVARARVGRLFGIHAHRAGQTEVALDVFTEVERIADPVENAEDLVLVDAELAELHTFHGRYDEAESASRRGLERLSGVPADAGDERFRAAMHATLHGTLGHLELRRMRLPQARDEFLVALRSSRRLQRVDGSGQVAVREAILNNLGVVMNQLGDILSARRFFAAQKGCSWPRESDVERSRSRATWR